MSSSDPAAVPTHLQPILALLDAAKTDGEFTRAAAWHLPSADFDEDSAKRVYLDNLLGKKRVDRFGGEESYLTEWKEVFLGQPPEDKGVYEFCMGVDNLQATMGFEMLFDNTDETVEVKAAAKEAFDGESRGLWKEWAVYALGNGDVEHGAMFAAVDKDGGVFYMAFFGE